MNQLYINYKYSSYIASIMSNNKMRYVLTGLVTRIDKVSRLGVVVFNKFLNIAFV